MQRAMRFLLGKLRNFFRAEMSQSELQSRLGATQGAEAGIRIVAVLANVEEREVLSRIAAEQQWIVRFTDTCGEAWTALNESKAPIVLCDRDLPGTEWRDVIRMMVSSPHRAYTILVSRVADDYLWNEVIRLGGHDLLATPFHEEDVLRAIRLAWSYWNSSMRLQPMLMKHYP